MLRQGAKGFLLFAEKNKIKINPGAEDIKKAINTLDGLHVYYMLVEMAKQGS